MKPLEEKKYDELVELSAKPGIFSSVIEVLHWDKEVTMPPGALPRRVKQLGLLASAYHEAMCNPRIRVLLSELKEMELSGDQEAMVREVSWEHERAVKVPNEIVSKIEEATAKAREVWVKARENNDFDSFIPILKEVFELKKEYAKSINPSGNHYETLFQDFEYNIPLSDVEKHFDDIKKEIVPLLKKIFVLPKPDLSILNKQVPEDVQMKFLREFIQDLGFSFDKGRLDVAVHPFSADFGRITTRFTDGWLHAITSCAHETGHALYEMNLPTDLFGTPIDDSRSLGIHESQSRLMEIHIGSSLPFWRWMLPKLNKAYSGIFDDIDPENMYWVVNCVAPGFIRVNADELTYPLHIILRFEIEEEIFNKGLPIEEIPNVWNMKMKESLGVVPPTDTVGCLQDTHWGIGHIGYFPTYLLGSMIAAQLWKAIERDIPDLDERIEKGDFSKVNSWLKDKIHRHGKRYTTQELIERATGKPIGSEDYINYLKDKYSKLYGI